MIGNVTIMVGTVHRGEVVLCVDGAVEIQQIRRDGRLRELNRQLGTALTVKNHLSQRS